MGSVNVFVYGTLMKGYRNHYLIEEQKFIGAGQISGFEMYHVHSFPGIIEGNGLVQGELYQIDESLICVLDQLESVGNLYDRKEVEVTTLDRISKAWIYTWLRPIERHMDKVKTMPWKPRGF